MMTLKSWLPGIALLVTAAAAPAFARTPQAQLDNELERLLADARAQAVPGENAPVAGPADIAIRFDVNDCDFGPALTPYFEAAVKGLSPEELEKDTMEFTSVVGKGYYGLTVTSAIVGYEWSGVAFAEPAEEVRSVFERLGFVFDEDGHFAVPDHVAVVSSLLPTEPGKRARGQSELICGV